MATKDLTHDFDRTDAAATQGSSKDTDLVPPGLDQAELLPFMVGHLLRRAENTAVASYYAHVGRAEVTPRQFAVLASLHARGRMTQGRLASYLRMDNSTINEMIPRMSERGLVTRQRAAADRRVVEIELTDLGRAKFDELRPLALRSSEELLTSLPVEYRRIFKHCLEILADI